MPAVNRTKNAATWLGLTAELDAIAASGRTAGFWWRDDDATRPGAALDRLLRIAQSHALALAVIPAGATAALARHLKGTENITVLQHGFRHTNHAPASQKKAEFGAHRPLSVMLAEIDDGRARLEDLFGDRFLPVFVPPWNRIADDLPAALMARGYRGVSCFGQRPPDAARYTINCHVDPIDWRGDRGFAGVERTLQPLIAQLSAGSAKTPPEPVGILTHHRDHDCGGWRFIEDLLAATRDHPAVEWRSATSIAAEI
jgi:hypothetical protein